MKYLGIDLGSSSIKGAVLDLEAGEVGPPVSVPFPAPVTGLPREWFEVDPTLVMAGVRELIEKLFTLAPDPAGLLISSQMGGVLLVDGTGNAVTNYLSWRDQRVLQPLTGNSVSCFDELIQKSPADVRRRIGQELKPGGATSLLYWLARTGNLPGQNAMVSSLGDYVISRLTSAPVCAERTLALGLIDLETGDWARDWFDELGFNGLSWPVLVDTCSIAGHLKGFPKVIPVYAAVGDHQAALNGAGLQPGELSVNVSTGSQVSVVTESWEPGDYQTRPFFHGRYLNTVTHLPAGRALNGLVDLLTELPRRSGISIAEPWPLIMHAMEETKSSALDVNLAFFASAVGDTGWIQNIRLEELTVGHLFRSAFENMADNYQSCAQRLSDKLDFERAVLSGGLPHRITPLREAIMGRFKFPARIIDTPEETLQGLLNLAREIQSRPSNVLQ